MHCALFVHFLFAVAAVESMCLTSNVPCEGFACCTTAHRHEQLVHACRRVLDPATKPKQQNKQTNTYIYMQLQTPVRNHSYALHICSLCIRDHGSDLYVIDMVKNHCLYKWYGRTGARQRKGKSYHKLHQIEAETTHENLFSDVCYVQ